MAHDGEIDKKVPFTYDKFDDNNLINGECEYGVTAHYNGNVLPLKGAKNVIDLKSMLRQEEQKFNKDIDISRKKYTGNNGSPVEGEYVLADELVANKSDHEHNPQPEHRPSNPNVFNPTPTKP